MVKVISLMVIILSLFSCASITSVVSVVGNASSSSKGIKESVGDSYIKTKTITSISLLDIKNITDITVNVSRGIVLLTGYVENSAKRLEIVQRIWKISGVKKIINELRVDDSIPISQRANDFVLNTIISSRILFKSGINSNNYSIDVVDGDVYVFGLAENLDEKIEIEKFLSNMSDIKKLITIIEIPIHRDNDG